MLDGLFAKFLKKLIFVPLSLFSCVPFRSRVRHGCQTIRSWPHQWLHSKTGRRDGPGSFFGRACRPSRSEFSVAFSETRVNTGQDLLERPPQKALHPLAQIPREGNRLQLQQPTSQPVSLLHRSFSENTKLKLQTSTQIEI